MKILCSFVIVCLLTRASEAQTTYTRLNPLAGDTTCEALAVSDDGTVVGTSGNQAVRWVGGIPVALGDLPGGSTTSAARSISADGTMIVGNASSANGTEAFLWTAGTGMVALGDLNGGGFLSTARAITPDGVWICGNGLVNAGTQAARYGLGMTWEGLGELAGGSYFSQANAVAEGGGVVVGYSQDAEGEQAFRWTSDSGILPLLGLPEGPWSEARAITSDGMNAFGYAGNGGTEPDGKPVRWEGLGQPQILTADPVNGQALACSASGNTAGGYYAGGQAFLWSPSLGLVHLKTYLVNRGVGNIDMFLSSNNGISPDGVFACGTGRLQNANRGFVIQVGPDPRAFATKMQVVNGFPGEFNLSSLQYADASFVSAYCDEVTLNTTLDVTAVLPSVPTSLDLAVRLRAGRPGLLVSLQAFDFEAGRFKQKLGLLSPIAYADFIVTLSAPGPYVDENRNTSWRIHFAPVNDEDPAQDSWPVFIDRVNWVVTN